MFTVSFALDGVELYCKGVGIVVSTVKYNVEELPMLALLEESFE